MPHGLVLWTFFPFHLAVRPPPFGEVVTELAWHIMDRRSPMFQRTRSPGGLGVLSYLPSIPLDVASAGPTPATPMAPAGVVSPALLLEPALSPPVRSAGPFFPIFGAPPGLAPPILMESEAPPRRCFNDPQVLSIMHYNVGTLTDAKIRFVCEQAHVLGLDIVHLLDVGISSSR